MQVLELWGEWRFWGGFEQDAKRRNIRFRGSSNTYVFKRRVHEVSKCIRGLENAKFTLTLMLVEPASATLSKRPFCSDYVGLFSLLRFFVYTPWFFFGGCFCLLFCFSVHFGFFPWLETGGNG